MEFYRAVGFVEVGTGPTEFEAVPRMVLGLGGAPGRD